MYELSGRPGVMLLPAVYHVSDELFCYITDWGFYDQNIPLWTTCITLVPGNFVFLHWNTLARYGTLKKLHCYYHNEPNDVVDLAKEGQSSDTALLAMLRLLMRFTPTILEVTLEKKTIKQND